MRTLRTTTNSRQTFGISFLGHSVSPGGLKPTAVMSTMGHPEVVSDVATTKKTFIVEDNNYGGTVFNEEGSATSSTTDAPVDDNDSDDYEGGLQTNSIDLDCESRQGDEDNDDNDEASSSRIDPRLLYRRFSDRSDRSENTSFGASNRSKLSAVMEMSIEWSEEFSVDGQREASDSPKTNRLQTSTGNVGKAASMTSHSPIDMSGSSNTHGDSKSPIHAISNFPRAVAKGSKQAAVGAAKGIFSIPKNIAKGSKQAAVGISNMPKAVAKGSKQAAAGLSKVPKAVAHGSRQAAVGISKVPQAVVKGSKQATIGISKVPEAVAQGSKQAAVGISKVPHAVAKGSMRAAVAMAHAPKNIIKGFQQNHFHQSSFFLDEEDHDHTQMQSYLGGRRRGLVHSSMGSDTINGSSMSIVSVVSSCRGSFSTTSSSSLPVISQNGNSSGDSFSRTPSSAGNSSDRRNNRTSYSFASDVRSSVRSSLSSMPSLTTITHDDLSSMPSLTTISHDDLSSMPSLTTRSHDGDFPTSIFDVDSRTSWTTCTSRGSIRALSPLPSPASSRRLHRATRVSLNRDDALAGRIMDELPICQLSLNHNDPSKERRRWDCSIRTTSNLTPLTPVLADSIPTYSTRYSSSRLSDTSVLMASDGLDLIPALPMDRDFTVHSPSKQHFPGALGTRIRPVLSSLVLTTDETPRVAQRRSSGSITVESTEVPAQRSSWSDSSVSSIKRQSSASAFSLPTLIEGGTVNCGSSPRKGMAEVAAMVADALGDEWSESETESPLT